MSSGYDVALASEAFDLAQNLLKSQDAPAGAAEMFMIPRRSTRVSQGSVAPSFHVCPAKTFERTDGQVVVGRSVIEHCHIVGAVAHSLMSRYPNAIRRALFPEGAELAAASHDVGKISPCFYEKLRRACSDAQSLKPLASVNPDLEKRWGGHAGVSEVAAKALNTPPYIAEILGQHHGFSPPIAGYRAEDEVLVVPHGSRSVQHSLPT